MDNAEKSFRAHRAIAVVYGLLVGTLLLLLGPQKPVIAVAMIMGAVLAVHTVVAIGAKARQPWARIASLVLGVLMLAGFPVGTIIGIYLISNAWSGWEADDRPRLSESMGEGWPMVQGSRNEA